MITYTKLNIPAYKKNNVFVDTSYYNRALIIILILRIKD